MRPNTDGNSHITLKAPVGFVKGMQPDRLTCIDAVEEIMRRQAIIPAIPGISAAGSILVGSTFPAIIATQASTTAVVAVAATGPYLYYPATETVRCPGLTACADAAFPPGGLIA